MSTKFRNKSFYTYFQKRQILGCYIDPNFQASYDQHLHWTSFSSKLLPLVSSLVPLVCWFDPVASTIENSHVKSFLLILIVA